MLEFKKEDWVRFIQMLDYLIDQYSVYFPVSWAIHSLRKTAVEYLDLYVGETSSGCP